MKISIISTHSFPIGLRGPVTKTGDVVIMDLVRSLSELGHQVNFFTPVEGYVPNNVNVYPMKCSYGKYPPSSQECETECYQKYSNILLKSDIVHDFSNTKCIINNLYEQGFKNVISTIMGGAWMQQTQPYNLVVWSNAHRDRVLRGATDYENTKLDGLAGVNGTPVKEAHVVYGGVDTDFYTPTYDKKNFYLWLNRWHEAKNYKGAIELAKKTGIELVMSGVHPDDEMFEHQKNCALEAIELAKGCSNINFKFLSNENHHLDKIELYRQAKALLFFGIFHEPFGLSQVEALACGTPVIGFNYGSVPEVITNDLTGYVIKDDLLEQSLALHKINNIEPKICREQAVKRFDRNIMAKSYLNEYENILNNRNWT